MVKKNPAAVALGRRKTPKKAASSARNAAKARKVLARLTDEERSAIGRKAAAARWKR